MEAQVIGAVVEYIYGVGNAEAVVEKIAAPTTRIVSLTVTEKGYSQDQVTGDLDLRNDAVIHDLNNIETPKTAIGYIVAGLNKRFQAGSKSFSVLSCDNLQSNGDMTKKLVIQFATQLNPELAIWIEKNTTFPNSMVDRITPRTTQELKDFLKVRFGIDDRFPVKSEEFIQWVIEDNFCDGRPEWEGLNDPSDFMFVEDVHPFEMMKLRLLNAGHAALAYFSHLIGHTQVELAMVDPLVRKFVRCYMDQATLAIPDVPIDLDRYKDQLIERFTNPLGDQVPRLCMDGAKKMKEFVAGTIRDVVARGGETKFISMLLASWIRYMTAVDEHGLNFDINDPEKDKFTPLAKKIGVENNFDPTEIMLETFGEDITSNENIKREVSDCLKLLQTIGARETLSHLVL